MKQRREKGEFGKIYSLVIYSGFGVWHDIVLKATIINLTKTDSMAAIFSFRWIIFDLCLRHITLLKFSFLEGITVLCK